MNRCICFACVLFLNCFFYACTNDVENLVDRSRHDFNQLVDSSNSEQKTWNETIHRIEATASEDINMAIKLADSTRSSDNITDSQYYELVEIVGELHYQNGNYERALFYFEKIRDDKSDYPRNQINQAACYVKKDEYSKANILIEKTIDTNYDNLWYLGNYYEIIGKKKIAIDKYNELYLKSPEYYGYCQERIEELKFGAELLDSLVIRHNTFQKPMISFGKVR
jgi:tetratricopeptide (TPR) repeat protein